MEATPRHHFASEKWGPNVFAGTSRGLDPALSRVLESCQHLMTSALVARSHNFCSTGRTQSQLLQVCGRRHPTDVYLTYRQTAHPIRKHHFEGIPTVMQFRHPFWSAAKNRRMFSATGWTSGVRAVSTVHCQCRHNPGTMYVCLIMIDFVNSLKNEKYEKSQSTRLS